MCPDGCFDTVSVYALHGCKLHCEKLTMFHEQMDGLNGKGKKITSKHLVIRGSDFVLCVYNWPYIVAYASFSIDGHLVREGNRFSRDGMSQANF